MSSEEDYDQGINRLPPGDSSRSSKYDKIMLNNFILVIGNIILFIFCMRFTNYFEMSFIQNAIIDCQRTTGLNAHSDVLN